MLTSKVRSRYEDDTWSGTLGAHRTPTLLPLPQGPALVPQALHAKQNGLMCCILGCVSGIPNPCANLICTRKNIEKVSWHNYTSWQCKWFKFNTTSKLIVWCMSKLLQWQKWREKQNKSKANSVEVYGMVLSHSTQWNTCWFHFFFPLLSICISQTTPPQ